MKTGLQDRLRAPERDRVAPDTGPMTGSTSNQQPSTIRGEAQREVRAFGASVRARDRLFGRNVARDPLVDDGPDLFQGELGP